MKKLNEEVLNEASNGDVLRAQLRRFLSNSFN